MVAHSSPHGRPRRLPRYLLTALAGTLLAGAPQPMALGDGQTLEPRLQFTDALGQAHTRMVHRYQGLRVWGSEVVLHSRGPAGMASTVSPALSMGDAGTPLAGPVALDLTPSVPLGQAQDAIRPAFGTAAVSLSAPEMVIYPRYLDLPAGLSARRPGGALDATQVHQHLAGYALAYLIRASADTGHPSNDLWDYLVDAHSGQVLNRIPVRQSAAPARDAGAVLAGAPGPAGAAPLAAGDLPAIGVGRSLYNGNVRLNVTASGSSFLLMDTIRGQGGVFGGNAVTDMHHALPGTGVNGTVYTNSVNTWGDGSRPVQLGPTTTPGGTTVAVDAAYGLQSTWDYFAQVHGRNGIDGLGSATFVRVNAGGTLETDNAMWDGADFSMTVLDGSEWWPLNNLTSTNFSGDGSPSMNATDLAILADAWGGATGSTNFNIATDLNLDGTTDDQDVALFFSQFGGLP